MSEGRHIAILTAKSQPLLRAAVAEDVFLSCTGKQAASHTFLSNCAQAVCVRQVKFLTELITGYLCRAPRGIKVLDWGCGKGHISCLLREHGFDVTSCDIARSEDDSAFGQETPILEAMKIPVTPLEDPIRLPFADSRFDCVVSFGVLEHVQSDRDSLLELNRVLGPGGVLFIVFLPYSLSWTQAMARAHRPIPLLVHTAEIFCN